MMDPMKQFEAMKAGLGGLAEKNDKGIDMSGYEEFVPPDTFQFAHVSEDGRVAGSQIDVPYEKYPNEQYPEHIESRDDELFMGGPLISEVESWKKQFDGVYIVDDLPGDEIFIYRTMNRYEYKSIMATPNTDPLMREEMICETCVLFPYVFTYESMSTSDAGIVSTLSEHIMISSGFSKASMPKRL